MLSTASIYRSIQLALLTLYDFSNSCYLINKIIPYFVHRYIYTAVYIAGTFAWSSGHVCARVWALAYTD